MEKILEVKDLNISLGGEKILTGVNFDLHDKENLVIVGPNGSGKTVLLKSLLGLLPYKGEVKWKEGVKISYVPQKFFPEKGFPLNVEEFFKFKKASRDKATSLLSMVGFSDGGLLKKNLFALSSGQMQRVLIAWGLVDDPDVVLFDEPTAGIDIGSEENVYGLLRQIEKERNLTMIMVTHDMSVVYDFADSVICLNKKIICHGSPQDISILETFKKMYGDNIKIYKHEHN